MFHTTNGFGTATSRVPMMNVFAPNPFMSAAYMNGVAPSQQQAHAQAFGFHSVQQSQLPAAAPRVVAETSRKRTRTTDNARPQKTKPRSSEQVPSPTMISVAVGVAHPQIQLRLLQTGDDERSERQGTAK